MLLIALKYLLMMRKVRVQVHKVPEAGVQDGLAEPVQWEERGEEEEKHLKGETSGRGNGEGGRRSSPSKKEATDTAVVASLLRPTAKRPSR